MCLVEINPYFERNFPYTIHHSFPCEKIKKNDELLSPCHMFSLYSNCCGFITQIDTKEANKSYT